MRRTEWARASSPLKIMVYRPHSILVYNEPAIYDFATIMYVGGDSLVP